MRTLFASLVSLTLLCACGYKGALYLPPATTAKPATKPASPPVAAPVILVPRDASQAKANASGAQ